MLRALQIRNFALIENASLELGEGLNILSGETGAGKSILIQALELLLGARGSSELIRQGEEESEVTGLFMKDDAEISLRRVISRGGKNRAYLDERPVPVSVLEQKGRELVDLAGQHEHQILLDPDRHLRLLDAFADLDADDKDDSPLARYRTEYGTTLELISQKETLNARAKESREREEFLRFQLKEISEAKIREGEEEGLQRERDVSKHAVRLREASVRSEEALESGEDSILERIARVEKEIRQASQMDSRLAELSSRLDATLCELQDVAKFLRGYGQGISCDPERLQEIEDRLALLSRLRKKHGGTVEALLEKERELAGSLSLLDDFEGETARIDRELSVKEKILQDLASKITKMRRKAAQEISERVARELRDLGMPSVQFSCGMNALSRGGVSAGGRFLNENGADEGEFLVAPNVGEGLHPLAKIASGGELSRVFLAIKKVLGSVRGAETCVFDEVDSGIGGRVAEVVGRNLSEMAARRQVVCITHLPQIACFANHHFVIRKATERGRTLTHVQRLQVDQREEEIARMLAGVKITDQAMAHARQMLKSATVRG
jgi:DNA repair protein RecN (Recombination protein N)